MKPYMIRAYRKRTYPKFAYMCPRDSSHVLYARVRARAAMARADHVAKQ